MPGRNHLIDKQIAPSLSYANFFPTCNLMGKGRETILVGLLGRRSFSSLSYANFFPTCNLMGKGRETILVGLLGRRSFSSRAPYIFHTPATQASNALVKSSIPITNRRPDKGQSCLTPLCSRKKSEGCPS